MAEYIERGAAIATAISGLVRYEDGERFIRVKEVRESLKDAPAADVVEVRHGHWIRKVDEAAREFWCERTQCSICGEEWGGAMPNYCPNCGAKMDESEEKDNG